VSRARAGADDDARASGQGGARGAQAIIGSAGRLPGVGRERARHDGYGEQLASHQGGGAFEGLQQGAARLPQRRAPDAGRHRRAAATGGGAPACLELERIEEAISASEPLPQQSRPTGSIKPTWAVALAWDLATKWGRNVTLTVGGDWWRLAAILYGRLPLIDLYRHMLAFEPELSPFRGWF